MVDLKQTQEHELTLEWESSSSSDMIADSTLALITGIDKSPASVKRTCYFCESENVVHNPVLICICLVKLFDWLINTLWLRRPWQQKNVAVTAHKHSHEHPHKHKHPHANTEGELASMTRVQRLAMFLEAHFGEVEFHQPDEDGSDAEEKEQGERSDEEPSLLVRLDEADARIDLISLVRVQTT